MFRRILFLTLPLLLAAAACGSSDDGGDDAATDPSAATETTAAEADADDETTTTAAAGAPATCEEVAASFTTKGSANADLPDPEVAATCDGDTVTVQDAYGNYAPDIHLEASAPGRVSMTLDNILHVSGDSIEISGNSRATWFRKG